MAGYFKCSGCQAWPRDIHQADARATSRHDTDLTLDGEELRGYELLCLDCSSWLSATLVADAKRKALTHPFFETRGIASVNVVRELLSREQKYKDRCMK